MKDHDTAESVSAEEGNRFFAAFTKIVLERRWLALGIAFAISGGAGHQVFTRLSVDNSIEAFSVSDDPGQVLLEEFRDEFGQDDLMVALVEGDVFSLPYLSKLQALHRELAALDMPVETLGQRRADRIAGRVRPVATGVVPNSEPIIASPGAPAGTAEKSEGEGFGDFESEDESLGDGAWGDEKGGSILDEVVSLVNARRTRHQGDGIVVGEWLDPMPTEAELPAFREQVLAEKSLVNRIVAADGKSSVIILRTFFMSEEDLNRVYFALDEIADKHSGEGFRVSIGGMPAVTAAINKLMLSELQLLASLAMLVMCILLFVVFRHPLGIIGPMVVISLASSWTFGFMAMFGLPMTILINILPVFLICVGVGDAIHIQSVYRDYRARGMDNNEAICRAVAITGMPCLLTSVTTMVALLSFRFASVDSIGQLGTAGAAGTFFAFVNSLLVLPVMLSFNKKSLFGRRPSSERDRFDRVLDWLSGLSRSTSGNGHHHGRRRGVLLGFTALTGLLIASGYMGVNVWHNPLAWMPEDHETVIAMDKIDHSVGGTVSLNLFIEPKSPHGMKDLELLRQLETLEKAIASYEHPTYGAIVGSSISILDALKETNRALSDGAATEYKLTDTQRGISDQLFLFESAGRDELRRLVTHNYDRGHLTFPVEWIEATNYLPFFDHVRASIAKTIDPELATVTATGASYTVVTVVTNLVSDLLRSFGVAFVLIALFMIVLFRNIKLGLLAMVPNILPVIWIIGVMGIVSMPIDLNNLLIGSIVLGIAVDDTIHFFHHFQARYRKSDDVEDSIQYAVRHAGRAIVTTSVILGLGFMTYLAAAMHNVQRFGSLILVAVLFALLIDIVVGPALLRTFYRSRKTTARPRSRA